MNYLSLCKKYNVETLRDANLHCADLRGADLRYADLRGDDLRGADLRRADLRYADLRGDDLRGADLRDADLRGADLRDANLRGAELRGADLRYADLRYADLRDSGLTVVYGECYFISICRGVVRAGCQSHTVEEWRNFSKKEIADMDGRNSIKYYPRLLDIVDLYCGKGPRPEWLAEK